MRNRLGHPLPILAVLMLLVAALACPPVPAAAHARLLSSTPANGAAIPTMPPDIVLSFSEPVATGSARVSLSTTLTGSPPEVGDVVVDGANVRFAVGGARTDRQTVTVAWRVVSATDGHETTGLVIFSVGTGLPPRIGAAGSTENPRWPSLALRALGLLGLALQAAALAGGWIGNPSLALRTGLVGAAMAGVGFVADAVERDLLGRQSGQLLLGAAAMALLVVPAIWARRTVVGGIPWLLAVATVVAGGHAAGDADRLLATVVGTTHAALGLAWAGLILGLALSAMHGAPEAALRRLGPVALAGVLALTLAGLALTVLRVDGIRNLGDLTYGRLILAKQVLLAAAVATAAANRLVLLPRLPGPRWAAAARPVLAFEALVLAGAVAVAGALSSTPPADGPRAVPVATRAIPIAEESEAGLLAVRVASQITGAEDDELLLTVRGRDGRPVGDIQRLIVAASVMPPGEVAPTPVSRTDATPLSSTSTEVAFSVPATGLAVGGVWTLEITVRRAGLEDAVGRMSIDTTGWSFHPPRLVQDAWRWPSMPPAVPILLATAAVVLAVGFAAIRRSRTIEPLPAVILLAAIVAVTAGFTVQAIQQIDAAPAGVGTDPPAGELDLLAAADDYRTYCLACHGVDGGGVDASDPLHDHGSGTDLLDADSRRLPNGHLYGWITAGVPGTTMPAYDVALTDQERWALVAYLRSLQLNRPSPTPTP